MTSIFDNYFNSVFWKNDTDNLSGTSGSRQPSGRARYGAVYGTSTPPLAEQDVDRYMAGQH